MSRDALTIWCNARFPDAAQQQLLRGASPHKIIFARKLEASNLAAGAPDPDLAAADVAFGQPDVQAVISLPQLRWVHLTTAGYERFDNAELRAALHKRGAILTTTSSVYAEPCAQHCLAMMLSLARGLPMACDNQRTARGWPSREIRGRSLLLRKQNVLMLGFGAIGRRLAELLNPFGVYITAVRRTVTGFETVRCCLEADLLGVLPEADHIIDLLPGGDGTKNFMSADRFDLVKKGACFYNIGRGSTVDQDALLASLRSGRLGAAYLDVTDPEPLPPDHPLWTAPNCHITPHTAGGHDGEPVRIVRHFLTNLHHYIHDEPMRDRII